MATCGPQTNRTRFLFRREANLKSELLRLPQAFFIPPAPIAVDTVDLLELKEPNVVGDPTPNKKIGLKAPSLTDSYQLCLPVDAGNTGEVLSTDGSGILSWIQTQVGMELNSTGVIAGGLISINADTTKFDVSDGNGRIFNTTTLTTTQISWSGLTAQSTV